MEQTFVMIKPDSVQRGLIGQIISRFELKGLNLKALKFVSIDQALAEQLYDVHKGKVFFEKLVNYVKSGPVVVSVWEGKDAIAVVRKLVGATKPNEAEPGTIRGDFGLTIDNNIVHASDATDRAQYEIKLFFKELVNWNPINSPWL
ncbi:MAG: Nucleoside diphosphate kinase [Candidatus Heimdallarchaeota archaeon LC_3]|nr:MAG: Nucleoside diphosphate kinase [Candidatus Heimdallarchaeota archaeon LC_3]